MMTDLTEVQLRELRARAALVLFDQAVAYAAEAKAIAVHDVRDADLALVAFRKERADLEQALRALVDADRKIAEIKERKLDVSRASWLRLLRNIFLPGKAQL